jgi:two-component system sensor histidine kinase YesM
LLIQPLVENAVFHGLVPTGNEGDIWIKAESTPDAIAIEIRDNGRGIASEALPNLDEQADGRQSGMTGIGLIHVHESIRLYYPPGSELRIMKGETGGTIIAIKLLKTTDVNSQREGA